MILKRMDDTTFVQLSGLKEVKKGDVFRSVDSGRKGPLMVAKSDPERRGIGKGKDSQRQAWHIQAAFYDPREDF